MPLMLVYLSGFAPDPWRRVLLNFTILELTFSLVNCFYFTIISLAVVTILNNYLYAKPKNLTLTIKQGLCPSVTPGELYLILL